MKWMLSCTAGLLASLCLSATAAAAPGADEESIVAALATASPGQVVSTVPPNGDLNPYGVAFVPAGFPADGALAPGDVLVSNFNNTANAQGTGVTIVRVSPGSAVASVFFQGANGLGLTTALGVLRAGFVLVGNLPSTDGAGSCTPGPGGQELGVEPGSLLVLDRHGQLVATLASTSMLDGPWFLAIRDLGHHAQVFVSNALSGTVTRIDLAVDGKHNRVRVERETRIASGYLHRCDAAALVIGPTGLALDEDGDALYVASTGDNAIFRVPHPFERRTDGGTGRRVVTDPVHLHGPLALIRTDDGALIAAQGDAVNPDPAHQNEIVEYDDDGQFVAQFSIDPAPGAAFGLALAQGARSLRFAAVNDGQNTLEVWTLPIAAHAAVARLKAQAATIATTTSLTVTNTTGAYSTGYTLTATVTGGTAPTGTVTFNDGSTALGMATLANGTASMTGVTLMVGTRTLTAVYSGDATNLGSTSAPVTQVVSGGSKSSGGYGAFGLADVLTLLALYAAVLAGRRLRARAEGAAQRA